MPEPLTPKARDTRARILHTALRLFRERGFERTTLRDVAREADASLGLVYRYFDSKEALIHELYAELSGEFAARVAHLPPGRWPERASAALDVSFAVLGPHRDTLAALLPSMTRSEATYAPLAVGSEQVRDGFTHAVACATDAPSDPAWLGRTLWLAQLAALLFWLLDRSPGQVATERLRAWIRGFLPVLARVLRLPGMRGLLAPLVEIVELGVLGSAP